jgi:Carbohydrate esterase, sialic acid-specific acetylesterase
MKPHISTRVPAWAGIALLTLLSLPPADARAQAGGATPAVEKPQPPPVLRLKEPVESRVYQRGTDGKADIPIVLGETEGIEDAKVVSATVSSGFSMGTVSRFEDGKLVGVPTGGPYMIQTTIRDKQRTHTIQTTHVYVGDLWVLAGQSNMEGYGDLVDVAPPNDKVQLLGMDGKWSTAEEPLHWLVDSPDQVHSQNPNDRAARSVDFHKKRKKGAGLGLPFADTLERATDIPIGLIATAHGGTSMEQWSPAKKDEGGDSLYGSMLRSVKLAGGKVKGVLWYQGESDAMKPEAAKIYAQAFTDFIGAVREDFGQPDLPFYFVQIGRYVNGGSPKDWNAVQDAERLLAERVPNTAVVASVDLELDDGIHIATQGQKRLGRRLARIAERELFGQVGATTPTFDRVNQGPGNTLVVKFKGVNIIPEMNAGQPGGPNGRGGMRRAGGPGGQGMMSVQLGGTTPNTTDPNEHQGRVVGLSPSRHIAGFSIHKEDGEEIPLIFDAAVGPARDTVILKLNKPLPPKSNLYYGYGFDPYCNLVDALDMAVPVFGPIALDEVK